jgi:hypothetical protein
MIAATTIVSQKEAAITACIDALAPVNSMECSNEDVKTCLLEALGAIDDYPNIYRLKRFVLKANSPDYNAAAVEKLLRLCILGEAPQMALNTINEALENALQYLQNNKS